MGSNLKRLDAILREKPTAFDEPITWVSNGERGHLHTGHTCEKVRRSRTPAIERKMTADEARKHTICSECTGYWGNFTSEQRAITMIADQLDGIENSLKAVPLVALDEAGSYPLLERYRNNRYLQELHRSVDDSDQYNHLKGWADNIRSRIKELTTPEPDHGELCDELSRMSALEVLRREICDTNTPASTWGGESVTDFFGAVTYRDWRSEQEINPLAWFAAEWLRQVARGDSPEAIRRRVLGDPEHLAGVLSYPKPEAFLRLTNLTAPRPGENLHAYSKRIWAVRAAEELSKAAEVWTAKLDRMLADTRTYLLVTDRVVRQERGLFRLPDIAFSLAWKSEVHQAGTERYAICVPYAVGKFLKGRTGSYYGETMWRESLLLDELPEREIVESALVLWEPYDRYSTYKEFTEAYSAAAAL